MRNNIFKQQRAEWLSVLKNYGKDAHLVLLQEAQTTPELVQFATANYHLAADRVPAFVYYQHPSGVMTLSPPILFTAALFTGKRTDFTFGEISS